MREQVRAITYRWLTPVWPITAVGLLVGAVAGGLAAPLVSGGSPSATVLIKIDPPIDANQIVTNSAPSTEAQQAYLAGEIVYLSSSGFADAVGSELKLPNPPSLLAAQQGQSSLVQITATEPSTDEATAVLDRALKVYAGRLTQLNSERTGAAIDAITTVIVQVRDEALANARRDGDAVDQTGLDGKLVQLEQQRLSLQSQQLRAPGIQVIEPISGQQATSDASLLIVGGGMLGGMVALAGNLVWRRRSGVIASAAHVDRQVSPVLLPVVRLGKRAGTYARSELSRARTLYGQLPTPRTGEILVVGASRYSGTEVVARLLYMGAIEHVSVTAINVIDEYANLSSAAVRSKLDTVSTDAGHAVIVDGGSVATAPQMLAVAERADQIVVVIRIGRDSAAEVEVLLHAIRHEDVPVTAICTKGSLPASEKALAGRKGRSDGGRHSLGNRAPASRAVAATPVTAPPVAEGHELPVEISPSWTQTSWLGQQTDQDQQFAGDTVEVRLDGIAPGVEAESSQPVRSPDSQNGEVHAEAREDEQPTVDDADPAATLEAPDDFADLQAPDDQHREHSEVDLGGDDSDVLEPESLEAHTDHAPAQTADDQQSNPEHEDQVDAFLAPATPEAHTDHAPVQTPDEQYDDHAEPGYANGELDLPAPVQTADDQHSDQQHENQTDDGLTAATPDVDTKHAPAETAHDEHDDHAESAYANGQPHDAPSAPTAEIRADQSRSFGTGIRQLLQFRRQPQDEDGGEQDAPQSEPHGQTQFPSPAGQSDPQTQDTERWVSLLANQGEQPDGQPEPVQALDADSHVHIFQQPGQQTEQSEGHLNGQSHDAASAEHTSSAEHDDVQSSHPEHGDQQNHHGDKFQDH